MKQAIVALVCSLLVASSASAETVETGGLDIGDRYAAAVEGDRSAGPWWKQFGDAQLDALVERALVTNQDVHAAASRLAHSLALADQARAPLYPLVSLNASASLQPTSGLGFQFGGLPSAPGAAEPPDVQVVGSATLDARYQIDSLWRQSLVYDAAKRAASASRDDRDAFGLAIATQVAAAYFDAVSAREQRTRIEAQIASNESLLELVRLRFERGEADGLDVLQQTQQTEAARARLPDARARLRVQQQRLRVLLGQRPGGEPLQTADSLTVDLKPPATGVPAELVHNRPDLRAAHARYRASRDQLRSIERVHLPSLGLSASAGFQWLYREEFDAQETWGAGLSLSLPLYRGGADVASVHQARATESAARQSLEQLTLRAVADVEASLIRLDEQGQQLATLERQRRLAEQTLDKSKERYVAGLTSYLTVLTAINGLHGAELNIVQSRRSLIGTRIQLLHALGGPWTKGLLDHGGE